MPASSEFRFMMTRTAVFLAAILTLLAGCDALSVLFSRDEKAVRDAYTEYRKALAADDATSIRGMVAAEKAMGLEGESASEAIAVLGPFAGMPVTLTDIKVAGDTAELTAGIEMEAGVMRGTVSFNREDGKWRIMEEKWDLAVHPRPVVLEGGEAAPVFEPVDAALVSPGPFFGMPSSENFLPDPARPPVSQLVLRGHEAEVSDIAFTPDARHIVSASYGDFTVRLWEVSSGKELFSAKTGHRPTCIAVSPDGSTLLMTDAYGDIAFRSLEGERIGPPHVLAGQAGKSSSVAVSPNGKIFATASFDRFILIGNFENRTLIRRVETPVPMRRIVFSPSGMILAASSSANTFTLWNLGEGVGRTYTVSKVDQKSDVVSIVFSPSGASLATGHMDSSITIWEVSGQKEVRNFYVPDASTRAAAYSPDGRTLASAHQDGLVYLWDAKTGQRTATLRGHKGPVLSLAFSPDGRTLASGGEDRTIIVWR